MLKARYLFLMLILLFSITSYAQFRKYSNEFLNIGAGAKGLGMGGAQVASAKDASAGYWNPAKLAFIRDQPEMSFMHAEYFAGIGKYDFAAIALPLKDDKRTLGFTILRFAVDDIPNTLFLIEPDGSVNYNNITTFSSADYALLFSYAQQLIQKNDQSLSFGVNTKVIHRSVGSFAKAWGFGLDAGIYYQHKNWRWATIIRDATTTFNAWSFSFTDKEKEILYLTNNSIPIKSTELTAPRLVLAANKFFKINSTLSIQAETNWNLSFDGKRNTLLSSSFVSIDPNLGIEANFNDHFFVRSGVSNFQKGLKDGDTTNQKKVWIFQPSLGAGFKTGNIQLDYAFTNLANQSNPLYTHIFSISIQLKRKEEK